MALEIRHNRAEHAHENFQFRRIAQGLGAFFEDKGWDGLLIGNPESEDFSRFRADAILIYNHGLLIIDLKDYQGNIILPKNDDDFNIYAWYNESEKDKSRLKIKGGANFVNPFRQLKSYRQVMYDIINSNSILKEHINPSRTCAVNLFSGAIQLNRQTPRSIPYYKITQESDFYDFLYDYNSPNTFSKEVAATFNSIFPAPIWSPHNEVNLETTSVPSRIVEIETNVEETIKSFLAEENSAILVLESMNYVTRDDWMRYILSESSIQHIPQTEAWTHSSRIRRKIKTRSGIALDSLYNTIYSGKASKENEENSSLEISEENTEDLMDVMSIKSDDFLDERAVVIIQEAHLVSRSLHQSELLRFGSGRLLEDLIGFLNLKEKKRKLICIGDPFSLSYGKAEESAISIETLKELFEGEIHHYRQAPDDNYISGIHQHRVSLAKSINDDVFNILSYDWSFEDVIKSERENSLGLLEHWFSAPIQSEPRKTVLFYTNDLANKTNLWIKQNCLRNTDSLAENDLLILNNNVNVPDNTGFGNPSRLYNGMYVRIKEVLNEHSESVTVREQSKVNLKFTKLRIQCLSLENKQDAEVWLNQNYFFSNGNLSREEQIAFKILTSQKLKALKEKITFEDSKENVAFRQASKYSLLRKEIRDLEKELANGEKVKTKLKKAEVELNKLERKYKRKYNQRLLFELSATDPILNSINAAYGWCITVHKSVGSHFDEVLINVKQGENNGIGNASYFRWLYSGITASQSKLYVSNPLEIDPFMDCQFEDMVDDGWTERTTQNINLEFPDYTIPKEYETHVVHELIDNAKGAICLFADKIKKEGLILERTQKVGNYISKAFFSTPIDGVGDLVMVFNNNGKEKITSIRAERNGEAFKEQIQSVINNLAESNNEVNGEELQMPQDFRKEIYKNLFEVSSRKNMSLSLLASHNYQDVFILNKNDGKIKFRLGYNGRGLFTYVKVVQKTNNEMSIALHNLFFDED